MDASRRRASPGGRCRASGLPRARVYKPGHGVKLCATCWNLGLRGTNLVTASLDFCAFSIILAKLPTTLFDDNCLICIDVWFALMVCTDGWFALMVGLH